MQKREASDGVSPSSGGAAARGGRSADGAADACFPPLVIRGKSVRVSVDSETGEEVFLVEDTRGEWISVSGRSAVTPAYAAITD